MQPQIVIIAVGLTPRHIGPATPNLRELAGAQGARPLPGVFPAVTLTAQASLLTGLPPARHGAVGNGWRSGLISPRKGGQSMFMFIVRVAFLAGGILWILTNTAS